MKKEIQPMSLGVISVAESKLFTWSPGYCSHSLFLAGSGTKLLWISLLGYPLWKRVLIWSRWSWIVWPNSFILFLSSLTIILTCMLTFNSNKWYVSMVCPNPLFLIEDLNSRLVSGNACIKILALTESIVLPIIHKPLGKLSVLIKFLKTCLGLVLSLAKVLGRNGCHSLNYLITTVIKRVSRWHLFKLYMVASVGLLWTGWNLKKEDYMVLIL
jgi:hypothetical protein